MNPRVERRRGLEMGELKMEVEGEEMERGA